MYLSFHLVSDHGCSCVCFKETSVCWHVAARDMIVNVPLGAELVRMFGLPVKLDSMPQSEFDASPEVGQHNDLVWSKLGGLTPDQIAGLKKDGVI